MSKRDTVRTDDGTTWTLEKLLGVGGQGEVWSASAGDRTAAAKLYHPHSATREQRDALARLIGKGSPAPQFLWPFALIQGEGRLGYVMDLREARMRPLEDFMARRIEPSLPTLLRAGQQLADAFLRLHALGLCYRDISFANVFFDPRTGDVRICDNDNVDVSGSDVGGVLGTPRFMAPEVVRREAVPSDQTDRYSLAVLLFFMLYGGHPLDGAREARIRCLDVPALEKLYGFEPLYVWHPTDGSNRPVRGVHDNLLAFEQMYPTGIRELFQRSFTDGLHFPARRVRESEWRRGFDRALDHICACSCGAETFWDATEARSCWACRRLIGTPARIRIDGEVVVLTRGTRLLPRHIGQARDGGAALVAEMVPHPKDPARHGLKNLTATAWTMTRPDGTVVDVPPGRSAPVVDGNRLNFGTAVGEIRR